MIWLGQFLTRNCMKFFSFAVIIVNLNGCKKQMANKVNKNETATALFQLENSNRFRNCRLDGICELQILCVSKMALIIAFLFLGLHHDHLLSLPAAKLIGN